MKEQTERYCRICGKWFKSLGYASHMAKHTREREQQTDKNRKQ